MTTPIRVFANGFACPNGIYACLACCARGPTHFAVRPPSACSTDCAGDWVDYPTLTQAMAEHPDIEWHQLPAVFGEEPEPELTAAVNAHLALNPTGPA